MALTLASNPFGLLQQDRNFRLFWTGQTVSLVGTWMQVMAQGWLALELTNNAFLVGLVASVGSVPIVLLSLHAGVLVDRYNRRRLVTIAQALLLGEAALLAALTGTGHVTIGWLLLLAGFSGLVGSVEIPARQSLIVELVGRERIGDAVALSSSGFNLARILGPTLAGLIVAQLGLAWCFAINALSYLAVLLSLRRLRIAPLPVRPVSSQGRAREGIRELWHYIRATPRVAALMEVVAVYAVLGFPFVTLMPVLARDRLALGPGGYGMLLACVGVGGLTGALFLASVGRGVPRGPLFVRASFAFAAFLVLLSFARTPLVAAVILLLTGCTMIVTSALANGFLLELVPDEMRGRLTSAYALLVVGLPQTVGALGAGAIARFAGVEWAIGGLGALMLLYSVWTLSRHPTLARG